ncbi:GNAT family N-acetyltransferase [Kineococcus aurantiacus]|uniref:GNAT superfamily N-acetyltransferase n=1 Tax=Kineococcus aurantiacus TaxID=37633 RepID=A0A7Y9J138_9ACTN|nr:GNAT family N-acetyltransferase [Kineococcus aurantiacus]NYD22775.1 GNAT superfamily N-acetyltransferase [Kineococcus aurantiacus]
MAPLTLDTVADLPKQSRQCVFWELDETAAQRAAEAGYPDFEKEAWVSTVLLQWGPCGRLVYVDDQPVGFVMYAPPEYVPSSTRFPTSPVSGDAVLLTTGWIEPAFRGEGLARMLLQGAAKDLTQRGAKAVEVFGGGPAAVGGDGSGESAHEHGEPCVLPGHLLESVGFTVVRPHHRYPRLRLELKNALSWREDVEAALERLLGSVRLPTLTGVAPT